MPSSYIENVPAVMRLMEHINPGRVLDVGPGYGKYGLLFRERLDDFQRRRTLDAVDRFGGYYARCPHLAAIYDNFQIGNFADLAAHWRDTWHEDYSPERQPGVKTRDVRSYDLVLMVDVLEHFTDREGALALRLALELAPAVLISTPLGYAQGDSHGNQWEEHRSEWPGRRLETFGRWEPVLAPMPDSVMGVLWRR